jgi:hypothetical protein
MTRPDNDEQQPGRWGSNRFIIILASIVIGRHRCEPCRQLDRW